MKTRIIRLAIGLTALVASFLPQKLHCGLSCKSAREQVLIPVLALTR